MVFPHRAVVAPLVNCIWTLHRQRTDLTLTVAIPEVVDRHWRHRILYDHLARRLLRTMRALLGVIVTSVPFPITD
jgi:uncharacterized protein (DUF2236 family)